MRSSSPARVHRPRHVRIENLLTHAARRQVLDFVLARESDFVESGLYKEGGGERFDSNVRRSRTLYGVDDEIWELFEPSLRALLPHVRRELGIPWFRLGSIERQLHVHRGGDFFRRHSDNGEGDVTSRRISAVYYFFEQPRRFDGGALLLFDEIDLGDRRGIGPTCIALQPVDNSLVFFASSAHHEVEPVRLHDQAFSASRLTITFWFREDTAWQPAAMRRVTP